MLTGVGYQKWTPTLRFPKLKNHWFHAFILETLLILEITDLMLHKIKMTTSWSQKWEEVGKERHCKFCFPVCSIWNCFWMIPVRQKSGATVAIRVDVTFIWSSEVGEESGGTKERGRRKWREERRDRDEGGHILSSNPCALMTSSFCMYI